MSTRILVAEDDRKQADVVRRYLDREGYVTAVVHDGRTAVEEARRRVPDLVVLDLMLPRMDGLDVCRTLRAEQDLPIIMLTARADDDDVLLGLAVGADDYLTKPYSPRELVARVRTVLRRAARARRAEPESYLVGRLVVDTGRHEVHVDGSPVPTTPAEFALLTCLAAAPGRAFTRTMLLEHTNGLGRDATGRTIDMHVMNLRRKISSGFPSGPDTCSPCTASDTCRPNRSTRSPVMRRSLLPRLLGLSLSVALLAVGATACSPPTTRATSCGRGWRATHRSWRPTAASVTRCPPMPTATAAGAASSHSCASWRSAPAAESHSPP